MSLSSSRKFQLGVLTLGHMLVDMYGGFYAPLQPALDRLLELLGVDPALVPETRKLVRPSSGIGRWQSSPHPALWNPEPTIAAALRSFGYERECK